MISPIHERYAQLLVNYCTSLKEGERVQLNIPTSAVSMARALSREILKVGAIPYLRLTYPEYLQDLFELVDNSYFDQEEDLELAEMKQMDAVINMRAPHNNRALQNVDKEKLMLFAKQRKAVQKIRVNETKWVGTLFPTEAGAQDAGMNLDEYESFVYAAMFLFDDDPIAKWQEIDAMQATLIEKLKYGKEIRIVAEDTDLSLNIENRSWVNSAGHRNMPSGEVFTGPQESSAQGYIRYQVPSVVNGVEVEDIQLSFKDGQVVEAHAAKGNDLLQAQLASDEGAKFLGELGIGTNYNIQKATKSILFDEKIGGTVHLALGQSYLNTGGLNNSNIHWDMICDLRQGGAIYLDGELFQENGLFVST